MKNREYQKIVAAALTAALVLGGSQLPAIPVWAQENVQSASGTKQQATARKDETVYVKLDASGNIRSVTVSDQLKNISGLENIKDVSDTARRCDCFRCACYCITCKTIRFTW